MESEYCMPFANSATPIKAEIVKRIRIIIPFILWEMIIVRFIFI